jgi:Putative zinc-finger
MKNTPLASDPWADRLSEYLDGTLDARTRAGVVAHLPGCSDCRDLLEELRAVKARAASLEDRPPAADLWGAIARRLDEKPVGVGARIASWFGGARIALTVPQLAAAAAFLVVVSGGGVWLLTQRTTTPARPQMASSTETDILGPPIGNGISGAEMRMAAYDVARYDATIADLESVLRTHRAVLDTSTVRVIELNLAIIDQAIVDARRALAADPASIYLNNHLAAQLQAKVQLLQRAAAVVTVHQG